jgi:dephospho-CoA kinase
VYVIGLTGNIGAGKSTVGAMLVELGARYVDADEVAHEVMLRSGPAYQGVAVAFGPAVLGADGEIDRRALGAVVFRDAGQMARLEAIVHPAVSVALAARLDELAREDEAHAGDKLVVVLDAIKLLESGLAALCQEVWVVTAPREQQLARLVATRGMSEAEALTRIVAQPDPAEKVRRARVVLRNDGSLVALRRQVTRAWKAAVARADRKGRGEAAD